MKDCLYCYEEIHENAKKCRYCFEFVKKIETHALIGLPSDFESLDLKEVRMEAESKAIKKAIELSEGVMSKAALLLKITRPTLYSLMEKYCINQELFNTGIHDE